MLQRRMHTCSGNTNLFCAVEAVEAGIGEGKPTTVGLINWKKGS